MIQKFASLLVGSLLLASTINVQAVEQTICFSYKDIGLGGAGGVAMLGDDVILYGGKCRGVKLAKMNKKGWKLTFVVTGLSGSFGMVFDKVRKGRR